MLGKRKREHPSISESDPRNPTSYLTDKPADYNFNTSSYSTLYPLNFLDVWNGSSLDLVVYFQLWLSRKHPNCLSGTSLCFGSPKLIEWTAHSSHNSDSPESKFVNGKLTAGASFYTKNEMMYKVNPFYPFHPGRYNLAILGLHVYGPDKCIGAHANFLIQDRNKNIYRIDPNGQTEDIFGPACLDKMLKKIFPSYVGPLNMRGLQMMQTHEREQQQWAGFCGVWCVFMVDFICSTDSKSSLPDLLKRLPSMFRGEQHECTMTDFIAAYAWQIIKDIYTVRPLKSSLTENESSWITGYKPASERAELIVDALRVVCPRRNLHNSLSFREAILNELSSGSAFKPIKGRRISLPRPAPVFYPISRQLRRSKTRLQQSKRRATSE